VVEVLWLIHEGGKGGRWVMWLKKRRGSGGVCACVGPHIDLHKGKTLVVALVVGLEEVVLDL
jgi:hypothetical protein